MTAAAPISEETLSYFLSVNIVLYELYGMTETTGPTTVSVDRALRYRAAGKAFDGIKLRINKPDNDEQGEVMINIDIVFLQKANVNPGADLWKACIHGLPKKSWKDCH